MVQPKKPSVLNNRMLYTSANNNSSAFNSFNDRKLYALTIHPRATDYPHSFNFWGRDKHFGRINSAGNPIIISEDKLKQLRYTANSNSLYALDFVADAWRDFSERVRSLKASGVIYDSGPYADLQAKSAWSPVNISYHKYMTETLYPAFHTIFMNSLKRKKSLVDFESFLEVFTEFADAVTSVGPLTLSAFVESVYFSPLQTGLAIEISKARHDDDFKKERSFLYDPNYNLIISIASEYGFGIDKNAPWRFVCDPATAPSSEYMLGLIEEPRTPPEPGRQPECEDEAFLGLRPREREPFSYSRIRGLENVIRHASGYPHYDVSSFFALEGIYDEVFGSSYMETWNQDMDLLILYLFDFYSRYVSTNLHTLLPASGTEPCDKPVVVTRKFLTMGELFSMPDPLAADDGNYGAGQEALQTASYRSRWQLKTFYILRTMERKREESPKNKLRDLRDIFNYYDFVPGNTKQKYQKTLRYIAEKYVGPLSKDSVASNLIS